MNENETHQIDARSKALMDTIFRVVLIGLLMYFSLKVVSPFLPLILWGLLLAIMLYPLHQKLAKKLKNKQGKTSAIIVACGVILLALPIFLIGNSLASSLHDTRDNYQNGTLEIPAPDAKVAEWPVIGGQVYKAWNTASKNFPQFLIDYQPKLEKIGKAAVDKFGDAIGTTFLFIGALIIAGIMMAWAEPGRNATRRILCRFAGSKNGAELQTLIAQTVSSVALGVLGVAFIQALIFGIGFVLAGIPAAGILAGIVLFVAIMQLPTLIIAVPVIILMWMVGDHSIVINVIFTVYFLLIAVSDNVLKPLLLGRGCNAPMPIILIGALGGMVNAGMIGMFLGAILLALGYQIFMDWSKEFELEEVVETVASEIPEKAE